MALDSLQRLPLFAVIGKYYMLIINVVFLLSGLLLLALGSYAMDKGISGLVSSDHIAIGIIIIGIVFMIVALVGFMGAIRESRRTMIAYLVFVTLFSVIEISIAIAAYARRDSLPAVAHAAWEAAYNKNTEESLNILTDLQDLFSCCGWYDPTDMAVPTECADITGNYNGCNDSIIETVSNSLVTVGAVAAVFGTIQLASIIFAAVVIKFFKPREERDASLVGSDDL